MQYKSLIQSLPAALLFCVFATNAGSGDNCHGYGKEAKTGGAALENAIETGKAADPERFPEISRKELIEAIQAKTIFLVDANGSESYANGHIPGAISFATAGEKFSELLPKDKKALIVAYCGGPSCSAWCKAADELESMGYTDVRHFKGGIKEWKSSGQELEKPSQEG